MNAHENLTTIHLDCFQVVAALTVISLVAGCGGASGAYDTSRSPRSLEGLYRFVSADPECDAPAENTAVEVRQDGSFTATGLIEPGMPDPAEGVWVPGGKGSGLIFENGGEGRPLWSFQLFPKGDQLFSFCGDPDNYDRVVYQRVRE